MQKAGKIVDRNPPRANSFRYSFHKEVCATCSGAGLVAPVPPAGGLVVCNGCNGRGYIRVWALKDEYKRLIARRRAI
jgi:hypothetical protein